MPVMPSSARIGAQTDCLVYMTTPEYPKICQDSSSIQRALHSYPFCALGGSSSNPNLAQVPCRLEGLSAGSLSLEILLYPLPKSRTLPRKFFCFAMADTGRDYEYHLL